MAERVTWRHGARSQLQALAVRSINNVTDCPRMILIVVQLLTGVIMARKTKRAAWGLAVEPRALLTELAGSRTAPIREVERSKILLGYADGVSISEWKRRVGIGRPMIYKGIDKALAAGVGAGLKEAYHRPLEARDYRRSPSLGGLASPAPS